MTQGEPADPGLDGTGRAQLFFNVIVVRRPSGVFIEELIKVLEDASVGTSTGAGANIFGGTDAVIPDGDGPFLSIIESGGPPPRRTHNEPTISSYPQNAARIAVIAGTYAAARTMANAAYAALNAVRNRDVVP